MFNQKRKSLAEIHTFAHPLLRERSTLKLFYPVWSRLWREDTQAGHHHFRRVELTDKNGRDTPNFQTVKDAKRPSLQGYPP